MVEEQPLPTKSWATNLFANIDEDLEYDPNLDFYKGENEDEDGDNDLFQDMMEGKEPMESYWPRVIVTMAEWKKWCQPWKSALVLKLLVCNISLEVLNQRLQDL